MAANRATRLVTPILLAITSDLLGVEMVKAIRTLEAIATRTKHRPGMLVMVALPGIIDLARTRKTKRRTTSQRITSQKTRRLSRITLSMHGAVVVAILPRVVEVMRRQGPGEMTLGLLEAMMTGRAMERASRRA